MSPELTIEQIEQICRGFVCGSRVMTPSEFRSICDLALSALRPAEPDARPSPPDMALVPKEPTEAMIEAACCAADNGKFSGQYLRDILKAVFAASPAPKEPGK